MACEACREQYDYPAQTVAMTAAVRPITPLAAAFMALLLWETALCESASAPEGRLLGGVQTTYPEWFKDSFLEFEDDVREAADQGRQVILFFHQDNCPYCNALVERNLSQKHIEDKVRRHFDVIALNLRGDRDVVSLDGKSFTEKSFAQALGIQFTPTLLFLGEDGQLVLRLNGYLPPAEFELALDYASGRLDRLGIEFRDFVAGNKSREETGGLNDRVFFSPPPYDLLAADRGRPIAVFFEQKQCPACDALHREVLVGENVNSLIGPYRAIQLDMWSSQPLVTPEGRPTTARDWAASLGVNYAPTVVLFSPDGEEVIRLEAMFKRFHTLSALEYVGSGAWREEPDFQRYLTERADRIRATGQDVDIWR